MEAIAGTGPRSTPKISELDGTGLDSLQFNEEIHHLITVPNDNSSSFTALLELPPTQAMELLHSPDSSVSPANLAGVKPTVNDISNNNINNNIDITDKASNFNGLIASGSNSSNLSLPSNSALIERTARLSIFATEAVAAVENFSNSPGETPTSSVKSEPTTETVVSNPNSSSQPLISDPTVENRSQRTAKRKEREKKVKGLTKKSKNVATNENCEGAEKLPYVHVRARRGEATDSHSLAERARREKINARMKLLQELVPGCNKISGTALVLDEIINHVQSLQRQVEFLSMRLAAVNPRIDFNLDSILAGESGSLMASNFPSMVMPLMLPEVQVDGNRQQYQPQWHFDALHQPVWGREEDSHNFITSEHSLLSYDSSANSASLHSNHQLKMEL